MVLGQQTFLILLKKQSQKILDTAHCRYTDPMIDLQVGQGLLCMPRHALYPDMCQESLCTCVLQLLIA